MVEDAVRAPLTNGASTIFVFDRTGNGRVHPQGGILLSGDWMG